MSLGKELLLLTLFLPLFSLYDFENVQSVPPAHPDNREFGRQNPPKSAGPSIASGRLNSVQITGRNMTGRSFLPTYVCPRYICHRPPYRRQPK
ncbi:hypothetical protein BC936DRAFT_138274 [Jimgerdemannia flammicorona]|nr:hypothetical protein BC936DRAFT_138274 [Jimgerdemannia flammicorona]